MRLPRWGAVLVAADVTLASVYVLYFLIGRPSGTIAHLIDLDGEANLPAWYVAMQLFLVALLLAIVARRRMDRSRRRTWAVAALPVAFLLMSVDEVAEVHETVGRLSDVFFPGGVRSAPLGTTGLWVVVVGVPFVIAMIVLLRMAIPLVRSPRAWMLLGAGLGVFLTGAVGVELLSNLVRPDTAAGVAQITVEELLELVGGTLSAWGAWSLAEEVGFVL